MPKKSLIRRWLKGVLISIGILFMVALVLAFQFLKPKSEEKIIKDFKSLNSDVYISYLPFKDDQIRIFQMSKEMDPHKKTLLFIHGSPGSALDFKKYLTDDELKEKYNMISYDRPGYGFSQDQAVLNDLKKEISLIDTLIKVKGLQKVNLIGYSYGGTIAAAFDGDMDKIVLLAPALKGELEPVFWMLNFYRWKPTRNLIPVVFKHAAEEKFGHMNELPLYEDRWGPGNSVFLLIHGNDDHIVPYENSIFLKEKLGDQRVSLYTIDGAGHALVWTHFELIKQEIFNFTTE